MKSRLKVKSSLSADQVPAVLVLSRVVERRSFTRAAAELNVSPSALSQTIRGLESRVGVRLLNRTTRRIALTEAGQEFLERVMPALGMLEAAFATLDEHRGKPVGTLRLNVSRAAAEFLIAPVLAEYARLCPDVTVELVINDGLTDIIAGGFDAGIRLGEQLAQDMVAIALGAPLSMAVVATPAYFRRHGKPATPADLAGHHCLRYRFLSSGAIYRWEFTQDGKDFSLDVDGGLIASDSSILLAAARNGLGIASLLDVSVKPDLDAGRLVRVLEPWCPPFPGFYLYYPQLAQMPLKLRALVDLLQNKTSGRSRRPSIRGNTS